MSDWMGPDSNSSDLEIRIAGSSETGTAAGSAGNLMPPERQDFAWGNRAN